MKLLFFSLLLFSSLALSAAPVVKVNEPATGSYLRGSVDVDFNYSDADEADRSGMEADLLAIDSNNEFHGIEADYELDVHCTDDDSNVATTNRCKIEWDTFDVADGSYTLRLSVYDDDDDDANVNVTTVEVKDLRVDNAPPTVSLLPETRSFIGNDVNLTYAAQDTFLDEDAGCSITVKDGTEVTHSEVLDSCSGEFTLKMEYCPTSGEAICLVDFRAEDLAGNARRVVNLYSRDVNEPTTPVLDSLPELSNTPIVNLSWSEASDDVGVLNYKLEYSFDDFNSIERILVTASTSLEFNSRDFNDEGKEKNKGVYYFRVKAVDVGGNESIPSNVAKTMIDLAPPTIKSSTPSQGEVLSPGTASLEFTLTDDSSGVDSNTLKVFFDGNELSPARYSFNDGLLRVNLSTGLSVGEHDIRISVSDLAGRLANLIVSFKAFPKPSNLSISVDSGAQTTSDLLVDLSLNAENAEECRYKNNDGDWSAFEPFTTQKQWPIPNQAGTIIISYQCRSGQALESLPVQASIEYDGSFNPGSYAVEAPNEVTAGKEFAAKVFNNATEQPEGGSIVKIIYDSGRTQIARADSNGNVFVVPSESGGIRVEVVSSKAGELEKFNILSLESVFEDPTTVLILQGIALLAVVVVTVGLYGYSKMKKKKKREDGSSQEPDIDVHFKR